MMPLEEKLRDKPCIIYSSQKVAILCLFRVYISSWGSTDTRSNGFQFKSANTVERKSKKKTKQKTVTRHASVVQHSVATTWCSNVGLNVQCKRGK